MIKNTIKTLSVLISALLLFLLLVWLNTSVKTVCVKSPLVQAKQIDIDVAEQIDFSKYITTMDRPLEDYIKEKPIKTVPNYNNGSRFKLTAYCSCYECCGQYALNRPDGIVYTASGARAVAGVTVAVDRNLIPLGSTVVINGHEYIAQDTGAFRGRVIDIYFDSHEDALNFGRQYTDDVRWY